MIPLTSRPCRVALNTTVTLTKKAHRSFMWYNKSTKNNYVNQLGFSSSSQPPPLDQEKYILKQREGRNYKSSTISEIPSIRLNVCDSLQHDQKSVQRSKNLGRLEWGKTRRSKHRHWQRKNNERSASLLQFSQYSYRIVSTSDSSISFSQNRSDNRANSSIMQSMNASALLDPLNFCKGIKLPPYVHCGSRSISGTDAAQRLLRGKRDFLGAARKLNNDPVLLDGHGVPPALFQHCVDMADALLRHYGPDIVECSFHNYYSNSKIGGKAPLRVRVRRRDSTNSCLPPPSVIDNSRMASGEKRGRSNDKIDWDHNLTLYLTVMERLAKSLGQVLELSSYKDEDQKLVMEKNKHSSCDQYDNDDLYNDGEDDFDLSSLSSPPAQPIWNVNILRGAYFEFKPIGTVVDSINENSERSEQPKKVSERNHSVDKDRLPDGASTRVKMGTTGGGDSNRIGPFPVVEFVQQQSSRSSGHVLIRLQGHPVANEEFGSIGSHYSSLQHQQQPVSLVFNACIQNPMPVNQ